MPVNSEVSENENMPVEKNEGSAEIIQNIAFEINLVIL